MITSNRMFQSPVLGDYPQSVASVLNESLYIARFLNEMSLGKDLTHAQRRSIAHIVEMVLSQIQVDVLSEGIDTAHEEAPF
jgi:hypothetical protein